MRIWNRTGRRPVLAAGNSNGDIEMLDFTEHLAVSSGWTMVSIKDDWAEVF